MTKERLKTIKRIFRSYQRNKSQLRQLVRPGLTGITYDKIVIKADASKNVPEQMIMTYLIDKDKLEREIRLVDVVYDWYADDRDRDIAALIDIRFRAGQYHHKATCGVYVSDRQGYRWLDEVYKKANELGERLKIFEKVN